MNADAHRFEGPHSDDTYEVIGAGFTVLNSLGPGLLEKPYENALVIELQSRNLEVDQQKPFPIYYKGREVGIYIPDLIINSRVIVDTKVIDRITEIERAQMLNYLRITKLSVGLILNFKRAKLDWERLILDHH